MSSPGVPDTGNTGVSRINYVVALDAEARPLIAHYQLKRLSRHSAYALYANDRGIQLIVSGMGLVNAAAAVAYLAGVQHRQQQNSARMPGAFSNSIWLNVGLAGHRCLEQGQVILAGSIHSQLQNQVYFPTPVFKTNCPVYSVLSVNVASDNYDGDKVMDMEAAGFFQSAMRFVSCELIHCIKVISDNEQNPASQLDRKQGQALIAGAMPYIDAIAQQLMTLAGELVQPDFELKVQQDYDYLVAHWHFTQSQQNQLRRLLQDWHVLSDESAITCLPAAPRHTKEVIACLHDAQQALVPHYGLDAAPKPDQTGEGG